MKRLFFSAITMLLWIGFSMPVWAQTPTLYGYASSYWGSAYYDRCVYDVPDSYSKIRTQADVMGYRMNGYPDVSQDKHWQGIQRIKGGNARYLAVSRSSDTTGAFAIVSMGSRNTSGERFRSNRLAWQVDINSTAPPTSDGIVAYREAISAATGERYGHAGGIQLYGNFLAVSVESKKTNYVSGLTSEVLFYHVDSPTNPVALPYSIERYGPTAGNVALTRLNDGRYLVAVGGWDADPLDFYVSTTTNLYDLSTEFTHFYQWSSGSLYTTIGDLNYGAYQNMQFVTDCGGTLYLVGSNKNGANEDWLDLFRVENLWPSAVKMTKVGKKHLYCSYRDVRSCDLKASGGTYIDPDGRLLFYSTEHDNDGPGGSVKFAEFWPEESCSSINDAWVEIFEHSYLGGRSLLVDYPDRSLRNYSNYKNVESFGDKASSVKWCLPSGFTYRLYEHDTYGGSSVTLYGNGSVRTIQTLSSYGFNDEVSSSQY